MALINETINPQNFELVRDRIGEILSVEIAQQYVLSGSQEIVPTVWISRLVDLDKEEIPAINISLSRGEYNNKDARSVDGSYVYFVDCYTSSTSYEGQSGDSLAVSKVHKLAGLCRAIIENPVYKTLGFSPPFNSRVSVSTITFPEPDRSIDVNHQVAARLEVSVRVPEGLVIPTPPEIAEAFTGVKLSTSEKGYFYAFQLSLLNTGVFTNQFTTQFK